VARRDFVGEGRLAFDRGEYRQRQYAHQEYNCNDEHITSFAALHHFALQHSRRNRSGNMAEVLIVQRKTNLEIRDVASTAALHSRPFALLFLEVERATIQGL
jgi:hypothetical protein